MKKSTNNFFSAKTTRIFPIPIIIAVLFYSFTAILGRSVLVIDILTFVRAVIFGQVTSYKLLTWRRLNEKANMISLTALVLLGLTFVLFTFYPLHLLSS